MIENIKMVSIPVRDQQKSLEFYTKKLGFRLVTDAPMGEGMRWIELETPEGSTRIALFTPPGQEDRIGTFCNVIFHSRDVHKSYHELKEKGVEFTEEPTDQPWGGTTAIFKDVDGNQFCMSSDPSC